MVPAVDDRLLPDGAAAYSKNAWLYSGVLSGTNEPVPLHTCSSSAMSRVYRIPNNYTDYTHLADADWLEFEDADTDVIRAPVVGDTFDRYYWASSSGPPQYNTRQRIKNGNEPFLLGVPAPSVAPVVTHSGGSSSTTSTRAYVYTWVSAYGEEGPPSPPALVTGKQDDTFGITLGAAASGDLGTNRNLTKTRIYRTVTATSGQATYFFVAELAIATTTYNDTNSDTAVSSNSELQSTTWTGPPSDLKGWVSMPNGMIAGFKANEVWFCEPYRPHAWPAAYTQVVDFPVVGLGVVGQTLVVCTQGYPVAATGVNPASVSLSNLANFEPCMSRGSILSAQEGVYYASPNGIVLVSSGAAVNITTKLITKDKWQQLVSVGSLRAARLAGAYYGYGAARQGVFDVGGFDNSAFTQEDISGAMRGILIDLSDSRVAFNLLENHVPAQCTLNDPWSGELFVIRDGVVYWINISDANPTYESFVWRSKVFQSSDKRNFEAMKVFFDVPATTPAQNAVRNTDPVQTLSPDQYGIVRVYADDRLVTTRELRKSGELLRISSGFKADFWQVELEGRVKIKSIQIATSAKELAGV